MDIDENSEVPERPSLPSSILKMFDDVRSRFVETGTRNRLVHVNRANTGGNVLNIVNERSDEIYELLTAGKALRFKALGRASATREDTSHR